MGSRFKAWKVSHIEICGTCHNPQDEFIVKQVGIKHFSAAFKPWGMKPRL
jgi:hypothetical protein